MDLAARLSHTGAFPHACSKIDLVETHISWVFLTGAFAYKVRKPVDFGFVNYTTVEQRERDCRLEVELNKAFCDDLYLGVVPITRDDAGIVQVDGAGCVIDWAVKMQQFSDAQLMPNRLATGDMTTDDFRRFGTALARIHQTLPSRPIVPVEHLFDENIAVLAEAMAQSPDGCDAVEAWMGNAFSQLAALIKSRNERGLGRACHGDLHLANLVWLNDEVRAFDCITFNDELINADPMNDVAFLLSDCGVREYDRYGYAFLDAYLEASGDYEGAELLLLYAIYRATVRAKVAALRHDRSECERYLDWAEQQVARKPGKLVLMCGVSGSGKSWVARRLASSLPAIRLATDVWRKQSGQYAYDESGIGRVYESLATVAEKLLTQGHTIILDATFMRRSHRELYYALAQRAGVEVTTVECKASTETMVKRLAARDHDPSDATADVMRKQLLEFESPTGDEPALIFDTETQSVADLACVLADHERG